MILVADDILIVSEGILQVESTDDVERNETRRKGTLEDVGNSA